MTVSVADGTLSETVLQMVATAEDASLMDLPPLYDAVDPSALNAIFDERTSGSVAFEYNGYSVTVNQNDVVSVQK